METVWLSCCVVSDAVRSVHRRRSPSLTPCVGVVPMILSNFYCVFLFFIFIFGSNKMRWDSREEAECDNNNKLWCRVRVALYFYAYSMPRMECTCVCVNICIQSNEETRERGREGQSDSNVFLWWHSVIAQRTHHSDSDNSLVMEITQMRIAIQAKPVMSESLWRNQIISNRWLLCGYFNYVDVRAKERGNTNESNTHCR